ncbi:MAG TPA: cellulose binding domain-containing protein [Ktedonobacteraceae bacterium]|nr:cellulose binding domain-containing protein [Ktedonobacteraceae bacterium]
MSLNQDTPVGSYNLVRLLGVGPVSRVYLATCQDWPEHQVVLKLFEATPLYAQEEQDRVSEEVRLWSRMEHPSILPVLDDGFHENMLYLVVPYQEAGSLRQRLTVAAGELLPLKETMALLRQVGEALHFAHTRQVLHANLKPENILFQADGKVLLADFLLSGLAKSERAARLLTTFAALYMAPEQFQGTTTFLSDQYALACLAYELLTGQPPFEGDDFRSLARKHMNGEPKLPSQLQPKRAQHLDRVLLRALAKRPEERYPDVQAFLDDLSAPPPLVAQTPAPEIILGVAQPPSALSSSLLPLAEMETQEIQGPIPALAAQETIPQPFAPPAVPAASVTPALSEQATVAFPPSVPVMSAPSPEPGLHDAVTLAVPPVGSAAFAPGQPRGFVPTPAQAQGTVLPARVRAQKRLSPNQIWLTIALVAMAMIVTVAGLAIFFSLSATHPQPNQVGHATVTPASASAVAQTMPTVAPTPTTAPTVAPTVAPTPTTAPTVAARPTTAPAVGLSCRVNYQVSSQWPGGFVANLTIANTGARTIQGWTLTFNLSGVRITNGWNGHFTQNGSQVTLTNANFNAAISPGQLTAAGFQATSSRQNNTPRSFALNGVTCR